MLDSFFPVVIRSLALEGPHCLKIGLAYADGRDLPGFTPGAHIDVRTPSNAIRQYSLCSSPDDLSLYEICIKREAKSRGGSESLHALSQLGDILMISVPRNAFALPDAESYVLIAGGIGITPLIPMSYQLKKQGKRFDFHYYAACPEEAPFRREWRAGVFGPDATLNANVVDHPPAGLDTVDPQGAVMLCGPAPFMEAMRTYAVMRGWATEQIHVEHFQPPADAPKAHEEGDGRFEVHLLRSNRRVTVSADQTIAEALLAANISVSLSCEQGMCGACITPMLSGDADHRDCVLSDEEKARNTQIALCCSRSKGGELVLDL